MGSKNNSKNNPLSLRLLVASASTVLMTGASALAATAVYDTVPATAALANQGYSDVLGNDFTVNASDVTVTELGAFDSKLSTITTNITVGLYDLTTSAYVTPVVNFNGTADPLAAAFVFKPITPVLLISGDTYSIVGRGFNSVDKDFNTNNTGLDGHSPITFNSLGGKLTNGFSRFGGGGNPSASIVFGYPSTFGAGTLAVSVPEPTSWALMLLGFSSMGLALRSRRRAATAQA